VLHPARDRLQLVVGELLGAISQVGKYHQRIEVRSALDELDPEVARDREPELIADGAAWIGHQ
jgi:hypothetical protein